MKPFLRNTLSLHLLFFISGATGLICEVVWTRWLTGVLGNASAATAIVLAVFMGGLGAGSWLSARLADRIRQPVRLYAFVELGVAALVMLPFWGTLVTEPLFISLAGWLGPNSAWLHVLRVATAVLAVGPPTLLMGLSLPLVVKAMSSSDSVVGRSTASAYAANSLGGMVGTVLAGFVLVEAFGLTGTALIAGALSFAVAVFAFWLNRSGLNADQSNHVGLRDGGKRRIKKKTGKSGIAQDSSRPLVAPRAAPVWILSAAAVSGFCALGYETIWSRILSVLTLNTTYAFSLMLAVLLFGLSLGSWLMSGRIDRLRDPAKWFVTLQILLSVYALSSLLWAASLVDAANYFVSGDSDAWVSLWFGRPLVMAVCLLLLPSVLMGASLPIACKIYAAVTGGIGQPVGRVYAANTFGSVTGALVVGLVVIPLSGSWWATVFCALFGVTAAAGISWYYTELNRRVLFTTGSAATGLVALMLGSIYGNTFSTGRGLDPHDKTLLRSEDEYGLVEVVEDQRLGTRWMLTNRLHWEGSTLPRAVAEQRKQGLLPLVLHKSPRRVLEIGVGTGIKLSALDIPAVKEAIAVEISPGVIEASRLFADYNHNVTAGHSKVKIICGDGRNYVAVTPEKFDVIVNGLLTPYRAGVSRLYTIEHFRNCRARLEDDGMFVVWIAIRQIAPDDLKVISRTLLEVFPHTTLWLDGYYAALVSTKTPVLFNADEIKQRCAKSEFANALDEAGLDSPYTLLASFVAGPKILTMFAGKQPLNTEDRPIIEFRTPRLGQRLNTNELAAEIIGTLSLLQEPISSQLVAASQSNQSEIIVAQQARWIARQAFIEKCYDNHIEAAKLFHKALTLDRSDDLARYELETYLVAHAKQCIERGLLEQAHHIYRQAVEVNPRSVGAWASLAAIEENIGNHENAKKIWQRVLTLDPHSRQLRHRVANSSSGTSTKR